MVVNAGLGNNESVITISYRKEAISERTAQKILTILDTAIAYLLTMDGWKPVEPDFKSVDCARKGLSMTSWHKILMSADIFKFPSLPSNYSPRINREVDFDLKDCLTVCDHRAAWIMIQAAWTVVLDRYTSTNDVVFGTALDYQRTSIGGEEQVAALTFAILPMHTTMDANTSPQSLFSQIEDQLTEFGSIEFLDMQSIRSLNEVAARDNQLRTLLIVQPAQSQDRDQHSPTSAEFIEIDENNVNETALDAFALVLVCRLQDQGVHMYIKFDSTTIEYSMLERMIRSFGHVLRQLSTTQNQSTKVSSIEATSVQDLQEIWNWNATVPNTIKACLHDLIAERAQKQPTAPVICAWDGDWTYSELNALSSRLALYLIDELGLKPGQNVLLYFEKSKWMPLAMLSVMKAGGVSIALDTTFPDDRLKSIIMQTQASILLSSTERKEIANRLADGMPVFIIQKHLEALASSNSQIKLPSVDPSLPIYVVYTSGSTGAPKGVIVLHQNSYCAVVYQQAALGF